MTKEHTPTPWKQDEIGDIFSGKILVAVILEDDDDFTNGNHIVKCVNMHDELVRLLKHVVEQAEESDQWWIDSPDRGGFDISSIKETLKKAGAL